MRKICLIVSLLLAACGSTMQPQQKAYSSLEVKLLFAADVKKECLSEDKPNDLCTCASIQLAANEDINKQVEYLNARRIGSQEAVDKAMNLGLIKKISAFCNRKIKDGEDWRVKTDFS